MSLSKKTTHHFANRLGSMIANGGCSCDDGSGPTLGSGLVGGARRRRKHGRKPKFNVGIYQKAIRRGSSVSHAKKLARRRGGATEDIGAGLIY